MGYVVSATKKNGVWEMHDSPWLDPDDYTLLETIAGALEPPKVDAVRVGGKVLSVPVRLWKKDKGLGYIALDDLPAPGV